VTMLSSTIWLLHRGNRRSGAPLTYITRLPVGCSALGGLYWCTVAMNCMQETHQD
jgi:hypothetical protein